MASIEREGAWASEPGALRRLAPLFLAGGLAGMLAGGLGSRVAMRIAAMAAPESAQGIQTEAQATIGQITLGGTLFLVVFAGIASAAVGTAFYLGVRAWLPAPRWSRALAFGVLELVVFGTAVLDQGNRDFTILGRPLLNVVVFGSLFVLHGVLLVVLQRPARRLVDSVGGGVRWREALVNVVFNAIDAMPSGGRLVVRTWAADGRVQCAVADTGFGMPEEVRRRALEPFFTTKGPKSRGLGLSVCHGVVRRYGGELRVESRPGQGTTVTLSLPEATAESAPAREPGRPVALPDRLRVLVIDDDAAVREILAESLAAHGHLVTQASDGAEGLAMFRAARHDFVFTDLGMPGMTGAQVAEAIKAQSRATPVVLVTGWDEEETRATRAGGAWDAVINKPFDPNTLAEVIARVARPA